jgi:hypothetical protein
MTTSVELRGKKLAEEANEAAQIYQASVKKYEKVQRLQGRGRIGMGQVLKSRGKRRGTTTI